jgi:phosphate starvation-inducible protein PhoH and related proteins
MARTANKKYDHINSGKSSRRTTRSEVVENPDRQLVEVIHLVKPLVGRTANQREFMRSITENELSFGTGCAGTGKTYLAASIAAELLKDKTYTQIILTRPAVEAGEKLGFLPGLKEEKFAPYIEPFLDVFNERLGKSFTKYLVEHGHIQGKPLAYMRSKTFKDAFVILDEAQNCTPVQMELLLTRIGDNCKVVVCGDTRQKDIPGYSGLSDALSRLQNIAGIGMVEFGVEDCVRSILCKKIVKAYSVA